MVKKHPFDVLTGGALDAARVADSAIRAASIGIDEVALARVGGAHGLLGINAAEALTNNLNLVPTRTLGDVFAKQIIGVGINDELINGWRKTLAAFETPMVSMVSTDIARRVSELQVSAAFNPLGALLENVVRPDQNLLDSLQEALNGIRTVALSTLESLVRPAALFASQDLADRMAAWDDEQQRNAEALRKLGWWLPWSIPMSAYMKIGRLAYQRRRMEVRRAMVSLSRSKMFREVVEERWMGLDVFRERRRWFRDALREHRQGRYHVSISLLLPHLEGIPYAAFAPGSENTNPAEAIKRAGVDYDELASDGLLDAITVLYRRSSFSEARPQPHSRPNRHWILHGRDLRYGNAVNSAKVLFAFDLVAQVIRKATDDTAHVTSEATDH